MSETSDATYSSATNLYEEINEDTTMDLSGQHLESVPEFTNSKMICALYLQDNLISSLPGDFFPSLPNLMWLDLRDNQLTEIPSSIQEHPRLTHLLLQNNKITALPNELGTVHNLKVLLIGDNPLIYPPKEVVKNGAEKILTFLRKNMLENILQCEVSETGSANGIISSEFINNDGESYNSVLDEVRVKKSSQKTGLSVKFSGKEVDGTGDEEYYPKLKGKCPKLAKSRLKFCRVYHQSAKYLKPLIADGEKTHLEKMKQSYLKEVALKKHKSLLAKRERILQDRRNLELLKNWRQNYRYRQAMQSSFTPEPSYPYDTSPEYMTLLSREDIEKDLPDKFKKKLLTRCKPSVPRKNNADVHLALKIKKLFENLDGIDLTRADMTPRTEQKVLLGEIQKISEIKQKLMELSVSNSRSVDME